MAISETIVYHVKQKVYHCVFLSEAIQLKTYVEFPNTTLLTLHLLFDNQSMEFTIQLIFAVRAKFVMVLVYKIWKYKP